MRAAPILALMLLAGSFAGCASVAPSKGETLRHGVITAGAKLAPPSPGWADVADAKIRPGVMIHTPKGDCPSNFVFTKTDNTSVFIGTTAYCVREMHVGSVAPIGTNDTIGVLIYSSFETMAEVRETDADALNYNDFAVFLVDGSDRKWVSPSMLHYGGPTGLADFAQMGLGQRVRSFADLNDSLPEPLHARAGVVAAQAGSWAYLVYGLPSIPGEMGAGVTTPEGKGVGVVVSLGVAPNPGANGVARLDALMAYAQKNAKLDMVLASAPLAAGTVLGSTPSSQS